MSYNQGSPRGCRWGVAPLEKNVRKKSQRRAKIKFTPPLDFLRNLRENLKGYFDLSREKP
jgi:hypothetical protein